MNDNKPPSDAAIEPDIFQALYARTCPDCFSKDFRPGPRGGLSQNIECRNCLSRFNVTWFYISLVWAERLTSEADGGNRWREDYFPR